MACQEEKRNGMGRRFTWDLDGFFCLELTERGTAGPELPDVPVFCGRGPTLAVRTTSGGF